MRHIAVVLLMTLLIATSTVTAEELTADELADRLAPQQSQLVTKGFIPGKGVTVEGRVKPSEQPSVDLEVNFKFNSAVLTTDASIILDQLGQALNKPKLASFRFQVAGHTDGVGGDAFNQVLSEKRASAVRDYLVLHHGITAERLEVSGYGKSRLKDPGHPDASANRRVQVTNIGN